MSIKSDLRKEGIEVIKQLNTLKVNSIATNIAKKLVDNGFFVDGLITHADGTN